MHRALVEQVAERLEPARITEPHLREIYAALVQMGDAGFDELQAALSERAADVHVVLVQEDPPIISREATQKQVEESLYGLLAQLEEREIDRRSAEIQAALPAASDEEKDQLLREMAELGVRRRQLGGRGFKVFATRRNNRR